MAEGIKKISENVIINQRALVVTDPAVPDNAAISTGALWSDPVNKGLQIKTGQGSLSLFDAEQLIMPSTIGTELLKDKAVTTIKVDDKAITEIKLANASVSDRTIKNGAVIESKIGNGAVTSTKIKDTSVLEKHIADSNVTTTKIKDKAVTSDKIADNAVNNGQLANNSVTSRNIAGKSILDKHYGDISIPFTAYKKSSIYGDVIRAEGIYASHLSTNAVVTRAIANGAVTDEKIKDASIHNKHLSNACVESVHLAEKAVTTKSIDDDAVTTSKCANKIITRDKLADDVIGLIGDAVKYDKDNNVSIRNDLRVKGSVSVDGTLTASKVYNSVFMDLAEAYEPAEDEIFNPGDIVQVNEDGKLTRAKASSLFPVVGIVSDEYAECFGASEEEIESAAKIPVGLIGKIHVNVIGPVKLGDKIALIRDGIGASCSTNNLLRDNIVGKALESNNETGLKKVLCLVYPS